jgi:hypothetical protein
MTLLLLAALTLPCDWRCLRHVAPTRRECRVRCAEQIGACQAGTRSPGEWRWCRTMHVDLCRLFGVGWCQGGAS